MNMFDHTVFWGETHDNVYQWGYQDPPFEESLRYASTFLDFYATAYYLPLMRPVPQNRPDAPDERASMLPFEGLKSPEQIAEQWAEVERVTAMLNESGSFVTFPGYEWQGNGRDGDHNVYHFSEGQPVHHDIETIGALYERLRANAQRAVAIPHHIAYLRGHRCPSWEQCDDEFTPFCEIYSCHGCGETDEDRNRMDQNLGMGPGVAGNTYVDGLNYGLHLGCIGSTDGNSLLPATYNNGLMGVLADDLTRESIWDAFLNRRVYGVTGDRIDLRFTVDEHPMGSIIHANGKRKLKVATEGWDAIDRIEILRDNRVIATHNHQGTWEHPQPGQRSRYKMRIECGWGPRQQHIPGLDRDWDGSLQLENGTFHQWHPCWVTPGQTAPTLKGGEARFAMHSPPASHQKPPRNATAFAFEADPAETLTLSLNGKRVREAVGQYAAGSRLLWWRDEAVRYAQEWFGVEPESPHREDPYFHCAYKAKLHKAVPAAAYEATLEIEDDEPIHRETHYRVRVEQRNGQRAWSSPIWVRPS